MLAQSLQARIVQTQCIQHERTHTKHVKGSQECCLLGKTQHEHFQGNPLYQALKGDGELSHLSVFGCSKHKKVQMNPYLF